MLPPAEKTAIVLMQWADQALENDIVIPKVKKELEDANIILVPTPCRDTLLLTATQEALELEAERSHLVKERKITNEETIMDHFTVANRDQYRVLSAKGRDQQGLFTMHERCHLVLGILDRVSISDAKLKELLVDQADKANTSNLRYALQSHEWIKVLTPLHFDEEKEAIRKKTWWPFWQITPPVDEIQEYYGPEIAYYFAFMGFLGRWLGVLGIPGLASYLFRLYRGTSIDEDEYTPFYGLICFVWAILLLRFWQREEKALAYRWGTLDVTNSVDEFENDYSLDEHGTTHRRPEFTGRMRTSPVTGQQELYYPGYRRRIQYLVSAFVTILMLGVAFFVMILSLNLQGYIRPRKSYHPFHYPYLAILADDGHMFDAKSSWKCFIPVVLHVVCILTLNTIYRGVARKLTDWENHMTQKDYENSLVLKRFLFEAFDCYVVLFYLAFFERDVDRLRVELVAVFNIDSFRRLFTEVILPMGLHYFSQTDDKEHPHDLHLDEYESFDDYMEILIQLGYVTLFASAYPLASLIMCGAVWMEIRSDCYKLTHLCQKPAGERVADIGMWKSLVQFMIWFCCLTNCLLFGFTSDQMMHYMPNFYIRDSAGKTHMVHDKGWIAILVIFGLERVLIYFGLALQALIPEISEELVIRLKRRKFLLMKDSKKNKKD